MSAWYRLRVAWQRLMHSSYEKNGVFMTEILKAIIFGIVEGITEWLPISSTGHMILLNEFLTLDVSAQFWDMFLVVIQLGAILAVVVLFWNLIWPFARSSSEAVVAALHFREAVKGSGLSGDCRHSEIGEGAECGEDGRGGADAGR